ncbi:hypothetical protein DQ04_03431030 [Trypanosoma grayi]|uniref:hypothetical protein n=1 Tax=Trypanosoma grayi TaxID=71804 RepID=UPI0004F4078F|nr:hypothetical protein DQ04_03431030 [Trypanosoma grayi]KEG10673.1 hypothetical protein DQ04_03431030 [Trypanosoma grayi]
MRVLRQQEKRKQLREQKKKRRMTADEDEGEDEDESNSNDNNTRTARRKGGKTAAATGKTKVKKVPRNTKRKKYYTLTKEDLYGDE